jgi:hypothetical protein
VGRHKVVECEVQAKGGFMVRQLLAEIIGQAGVT